MGKPIYIKVEKILNRSKSEVWKTIAENFGNVSEYNPAIKASNFMGDKRGSVGTRRHCDFTGKGWIEEEITHWNPENDFKLKFIKSSMPLKFMESKFSFTEEKGQTRITQEFWYRMGGPMGFLSGMMSGRMEKMLIAGLNGLENHLNNK